jgi:hypothetical protein
MWCMTQSTALTGVEEAHAGLAYAATDCAAEAIIPDSPTLQVP